MDIVNAKRGVVLKTGEPFIDVEATIEVGGEVETVKRGYPVDTTADDIKADLEKAEAVRNQEVEQGEANAAREAEEEAVDETLTELNGD